MTSYNVVDAVYRPNHAESRPYWVLCPKCYRKLFSKLQRYKNVTTTYPKEINTCFTSSNADYRYQPTMTVDAQGNVSIDKEDMPFVTGLTVTGI